MVWPTPRSPSVWAFRAQLSSPAAAATCTAGWLGSLIGPGQVGRRPCAGLTGLRSSRSRSTRPHPGWTTHWSTRLLARELGVSRDTVARVWREYGIKPWRAETFKFSTDPQLAAKVHDVVGLYLRPPERAVVLCVDEKSQIQALERTQPVRRVWLDRPEQRTHDYVRHGTTTLFAPWRSPPGMSWTSASLGTAIRSFWRPSSRWPPPGRAGSCM
jgi:hypothetical protein